MTREDTEFMTEIHKTPGYILPYKDAV